MKHVVRLKSFPHSLHWEGFPPEWLLRYWGYSVLCRWGLAMFWAFGFPSHVNYVSIELLRNFYCWMLSHIFAIHNNSLVPIACIWIASSDQGCNYCIQGPLWAWIICVSKEKHCLLADSCFNNSLNTASFQHELLGAKSEEEPSICCHISSTLEFLP